MFRDENPLMFVNIYLQEAWKLFQNRKREKAPSWLICRLEKARVLPRMVGPVLNKACLSIISRPVLLHAVLCLLTVVYQELFLGIGEGRGRKGSFPPVLFVFGYH